MAGLGLGAQQMQMQPEMPEEDDMGMMREASPEEQAQYNTVVGMAMIMMYDQKMMPQIVQAIQSAEDPAAEIGEIAAMLGMRIYTQAKSERGEIPGSVMLAAGKEVVELLGEMAEMTGAEIPDDQLEMAYYQAVDRFRSMLQQSGGYSDEAIDEDIGSLAEMTESGQLDQLLQAISQAQNSEGPAEPPEPEDQQMEMA